MAAGLWLAASSLQAQMKPITVTGYNRDVVVEAAADPDQPGANYAQPFDVVSNTAFVEYGWNDALLGLPPGGRFTSLDGTTTFQLGPFAGNNVLFLAQGGVQTATLTLTTPGRYVSFAVLAASGKGGGDGTFQLNFLDGSSSELLTYDAPYWYGGSGTVATHGFGHFDFNLDNIGWDGILNPNLYQTDFNLTDSRLRPEGDRFGNFQSAGRGRGYRRLCRERDGVRCAGTIGAGIVGIGGRGVAVAPPAALRSLASNPQRFRLQI